jgi:FAD/FMN-containing dehydrogenase
MTLSAGVQWHEAYDAVQAQGRVLVGGLSAGGSVGAAGGWLLGGGHSILSPYYGLGNIMFLGSDFIIF